MLFTVWNDRIWAILTPMPPRGQAGTLKVTVVLIWKSLLLHLPVIYLTRNPNIQWTFIPRWASANAYFSFWWLLPANNWVGAGDWFPLMMVLAISSHDYRLQNTRIHCHYFSGFLEGQPWIFHSMFHTGMFQLETFFFLCELLFVRAVSYSSLGLCCPA